MLMPRHDIEHSDAMAGDAAFPPQTPGVLVIRFPDVDMTPV
jgi:hypothetical protein